MCEEQISTTCHDTFDQDPSMFKCSECGLTFNTQDDGLPVLWIGVRRYLEKPRYCPGCGCKVVER